MDTSPSSQNNTQKENKMIIDEFDFNFFRVEKLGEDHPFAGDYACYYNFVNDGQLFSTVISEEAARTLFAQFAKVHRKEQLERESYVSDNAPKTITSVNQVKVGMILGWENGMGFKAHGPVYLEEGVLCIAIGAGRHIVTGLLEIHGHLTVISE
jgi:hypothetical protein